MSSHASLDRVTASAFCLLDTLTRASTGHWHVHVHHQLLFVSAGMLVLHAAERAFLLPPQRAALIRASTRHRVEIRGSGALCTVYFRRRMIRTTEPCAVFPVDALAREMILGSARWGTAWDGKERTGVAYFRALAALVEEWASRAGPWALPVPRSPGVKAAMDHALSRLERPVSVEEAARVAGMSTRTLARRLEEESGTTWRAFIHQARMLKALEVLADPRHNVTDAVYACGFASPGAFTRAFTAFAGERPVDFRRRVRSRGAPDGAA